MDTSACETLGGHVSTPGHCRGSANIECCTSEPHIESHPPTGWSAVPQARVTTEMTAWAAMIVESPEALSLIHIFYIGRGACRAAFGGCEAPRGRSQGQRAREGVVRRGGVRIDQVCVGFRAAARCTDPRHGLAGRRSRDGPDELRACPHDCEKKDAVAS